MTKSHHVLTALGLLIFAGWAAHFAVEAEENPSLECMSSSVSTFGWTHRDRPLAEMAAILRWRDETAERAPGYAMWHNAQRRHLSCRAIGRMRHFQCRISATPCRRVEQKGI